MRSISLILACLIHAYVTHGFLRFNCYIGSSEEMSSMNLTALTDKCTHISFTYADIDGGKIALVNENLDSRNIKLLNGLKDARDVKILIGIAGYGKAYRLSAMSRTQGSRRIFIDSVWEFITKFGLDGVLIDWRYPKVNIEAQGVDRSQDKENFARLIEEMRRKFGSQYVIGVTVGASHLVLERFRPYDERMLNRDVDFVDILAFSYHGDWDSSANHHAPLGPPADRDQADNIRWAVKKWSRSALSLNKMNVVLAAFGYLQNLEDENNPKPFSATSGGELKTYSQICKLGWKDAWFPGFEAPVAISERQWISYDDAKSLKLKLSYLKSQNIGGVSFDSIDKDDWNSQCGQPLVNAVTQEIFTASVQEISTAIDQEIFTASDVLVKSHTLIYWLVGLVILSLVFAGLFFCGRRSPAAVRAEAVQEHVYSIYTHEQPVYLVVH
ncbi:Chitinase-3-like protein 1 [Halotydeus destructor]|nr:Chitinase-3-like protein 1 [Halotydeus destructor]